MIQQLFKKIAMTAMCGSLILPMTVMANSGSMGLELDATEEMVNEVPVEAIQKFVEIYTLIKRNYIQEVSDEKLFEQAISGLAKVDAYSRYLDRNAYQDLIKYTEGDLATVDFELSHDLAKNEWRISQLKEFSDASKSGLQNGLVVRKIDNQTITGLNRSQVKELLTGQIGSSVSLLLDKGVQSISVIRNKKINVDVEYKLLKNKQVLWIKIPVFKQGTAKEVKRLIQDFSEANHIQNVLIDLRNNPGGLLSSAVETADLFLTQGLIVSTKSRSEGNQSFRAVGEEAFKQKLGIMINAKSASAAEVLTAALKQHYRAIVIGEKSYGKGVVQKILPVKNGDAISLTVANYYTPDGQQLEGKGIEPNLTYPIGEMSEESYLEHIAGLMLDYYQKNR